MKKDEVKTLCEADDKLQWWAMVLFAEICDLAHATEQGVLFNGDLGSCVRRKCEEFPRLVIHRQIEKAESTPAPSEGGVHPGAVD